jgi:lysozyme
MKTSAAGRAALTQREGLRLTAYRDSKGIPTVGVGHVNATPPVTVMGMTISRAQADVLLAADLAPMEAVVNAAAPRGIPQNAFDAAVSLAFNIGAHGFAGSTVARKIASGDMSGAADAFLLWNKPPELMGRRRAERTQFLTPDDHPAIASDPSAPVLNGIIAALNAAAKPVSTPPRVPLIPPVSVGPHNLPAQKPTGQGWFSSLLSMFKRAA